MKIYTKAGDDGTTGLLAAGRVPKHAPRIEAYGAVDELNALVGVVRAGPLDRDLDESLERVQEELFVIGSALADPDPAGPFHNAVTHEYSARLELEIDTWEAVLTPLRQFILPGGTPLAAHVHLARTVCRRAERSIVGLAAEGGEHVPAPLVAYVNRLSDWLFVLARVCNQRAGVADVPWSGS